MALEEEFDIEIPDKDAEKITTVQEVVNYLYQQLSQTDNKNNWNTIEDLSKKLHSAMSDGKESISSILGLFLKSLIEVLGIARKEKFVYLLIGRTGVGKSSTVNALMGKLVENANNVKILCSKCFICCKGHNEL